MNLSIASQTKWHIFLALFASLYILVLGCGVSYALSERDMWNPTILANEGWKYLTRGGTQNYDRAEEFFRKAIDLDEHNADAYAGLGVLTMWREHRPFTEFNKDQCRKAMEFIERAVSSDNKNVRAHYRKGEALLCLEYYDAAIREADILEDIGYSGCLLHGLRCKAYKGRSQKKIDTSDQKMAILEGTDYLECAQRVNSSWEMADASNILRDLLVTTKDYDSTAKYFKRNIELKPYSLWSYHNYYWLLLLRNDEGDLAEAKDTINKAKAVLNLTIGALWEIRYKRGEKYFTLKQYDKALVEYTEFLAEHPDDFVTRERMPYICSQFTDGRCVKAWQRIIRAYLDRGDCSRAAKEFKVQYANDPNSFEQFRDAVSQCEEKGR